MRSFIQFLTIFLTLYGIIHAYAYWVIRRNVSWNRPWGAVLGVIFAGFLLAPVLGHTLASRGLEALSFPVLLAGYEWMAALFLFVSAQAFLDGARLLLSLVRRFAPTARLGGSPGKKAFFLVSAAALGAFVYGHFEARHLYVEKVELRSPKLGEGVERLRVVQISDLHFSFVNGIGMAERVADRVQALEPDILVATGDLVDRGLKDPEGVTGILRRIHAPMGKYAVTGNHEFYHGEDRSVDFMIRAGFHVLRGEAARPAPWLSILGIDDEAALRFAGPKGASVDTLLSRAPERNLVLLLRHRPRIDPGTEGLFDLQLSGHTHGGQIFPFGWIVSLVHPYVKGTHELDKGSLLHVNRGAGTWGPPLRLLSPPEITVIEYRRP